MASNREDMIATEGVSVVGNEANRFDCWRQSGTLGPEPPTADSGPPETNGQPGMSGPPSATE